jgi:hypothetical protein
MGPASHWGSGLVQSAHSEAADGRASVPNQEQIVTAVSRLLQRAALGATEVSVQVLKKALVARHAVRCGAATLTQVAEWYSVTPAALRGDINRYRVLAPGLFNASLNELFDSEISTYESFQRRERK